MNKYNSTDFNNNSSNQSFNNHIYSINDKFNIDFFDLIESVILIILLSHLIYLIFSLIKHNIINKEENLLSKLLKSTNYTGNKIEITKINDTCTICLDNIINEVLLLCNHAYCANCLIEFRKASYNNSLLVCPYCRKESDVVRIKFNKDITSNSKSNNDYDYLINYNKEYIIEHSVTYILAIDFYRYSLKKVKLFFDFGNLRYGPQRRILALFIILVSLTIIIPSFEDYIIDKFFEMLITGLIGILIKFIIRREIVNNELQEVFNTTENTTNNVNINGNINDNEESNTNTNTIDDRESDSRNLIS